jgi:hypothetical protein
VSQDEVHRTPTSTEGLGHFWSDERDELPGARVLAGALDLNHPSEPGGLQEIGTCRTCGLIIARDKQGIWSHQPSVEEFGAGQAWIDHHPGSGAGRPEWTLTERQRAESNAKENS